MEVEAADAVSFHHVAAFVKALRTLGALDLAAAFLEIRAQAFSVFELRSYLTGDSLRGLLGLRILLASSPGTVPASFASFLISG